MAAAELFGWDHFHFTDDEKDLSNQDSLDSLLTSYYKLQSIDFNTSTRPGGPENALPLLKRGVFTVLVGRHILADPVSDFLHITWGESNKCYKDAMYQKINAILARKDIIFIDPYDEEPFQYPVIPRSAFPAEAMPNITAHINTFLSKWPETRTKIINPYGIRRLKPRPQRAEARPQGLTEQLQQLQLREASRPRRSDAEIFAQLQAFSPLPGQSKEASKARLDQLFEDVDVATMDRLMVQAEQFKRQSEMNLASSFLHSQRMQVEASAEAFKTQDRGNLGGRWEWKRY